MNLAARPRPVYTRCRRAVAVHLRRVLKDTEAKKNVELRSGCVVTLLPKDKQGRVTQVRYKKWNEAGMPERTVSAPIIVLAANAIETPKLLSCRTWPIPAIWWVAISWTTSWEVTALFDEPIYPFRGPQSVTGIESFREGPFRSERSAFRMTIGNDGWGRAGSPATIIDKLMFDPNNKTRIFGPGLLKNASDQITRMIRLSFSTEMLPSRNNRVQASTNVDGALRLPRPLITFGVDEYSKGGLTAGFETSKKIFELVKAAIVDEKAHPVIR